MMHRDQLLSDSAATMVAKKHYSLGEIYRITQLAARTVLASRDLPCDRQTSERIMLAVTEVNGCALCSYAHTGWALEMGISEAEVRSLLSGVSQDVPADQLPGIAFGQHYADTRGNPDPDAWSILVDKTGFDQALCTLRATRMMMWGNAVGIPLSSLRSRLRGTPDPHSTLAYEIGTTLGSLAIMPIAVTNALSTHIRNSPIEPRTQATGIV